MNKKDPLKPNLRKETSTEETERILWENEDTGMAKPKHMDNPNIVKKENWKKAPKLWDGYSNLTDDQKQQSVAWSNHLDIAKKPKTLADRKAAAETRKMILRDYNNPKLKNTLGSDELKLVGKHKSQLNRQVVTPVITPMFKTQVREFIPRQPEKTLEEYLRFRSVVKPGLSDDLVKFQREVNKNLEYVMSSTDDPESEKERTLKTNTEDNDYAE